MTAKKTEMARGYTCSSCGREHPYPAYVFAHWREILTHVCECGAKVEIILGVAHRVGRPQRRKRA